MAVEAGGLRERPEEECGHGHKERQDNSDESTVKTP